MTNLQTRLFRIRFSANFIQEEQNENEANENEHEKGRH